MEDPIEAGVLALQNADLTAAIQASTPGLGPVENEAEAGAGKTAAASSSATGSLGLGKLIQESLQRENPSTLAVGNRHSWWRRSERPRLAHCLEAEPKHWRPDGAVATIRNCQR